MNSNIIKFIPILSVNFASITGDFVALDLDGFPGALSYIHVLNTIDVPIMVSLDGAYGHMYLKAFTGESEINLQECSSQTNKRSLIKKKSKVYVKQLPGLAKTGFIVISGFYQN